MTAILIIGFVSTSAEMFTWISAAIQSARHISWFGLAIQQSISCISVVDFKCTAEDLEQMYQLFFFIHARIQRTAYFTDSVWCIGYI